MERAAGHLARTVVEVAGGGYGRRAVVLVGKGDNGGDGWAAARRLHRAGMQVTVVAPQGLDADGSDATTTNRERWLAVPGGRSTDDLERLPGLLAAADVAVDCLLGTGATGALREPIGQVVATLAEVGVPTVACDVPTGVDADSGAVVGDAVRASATVTFGAIKPGLLLHPGAEFAGRIVVGDLGPNYPTTGSGWRALTAAGAAADRFASDAEKRSRGVALAVVGATGTAGAAALCAMGLQSGGAGLVTAAVPEPVLDVVAGLSPAVMTRALPHDHGTVTPDAVELLDDLDGFDVVVAGPGLGPTKGTRAVVDHLRANASRLVLDADAINVHRDDPAVLADHHGVLVLTPHERELARLAGHEIAGDRAEVAMTLAERFDATIVAKGPGTVVAAPDGRVWVTPVGGPALASGGTGDVLAGMVGAAIAAADDAPLAVARAVWQHAFAGVQLGNRRAQRLRADHLAQWLPRALDRLTAIAAERPAWPLDGAPLPDRLEPR